MNKPDFIDEFFPFLREKIFWLSIFLVFGLLIVFLVRGLIPNRLEGGSVYGFTGAYGPAMFETGFDLKALGLCQTEQPPTFRFAKLVGKEFTDQISGKDYIVFAMKNDEPQKDVILLLHVQRSHDILTTKEEKRFGGDTVLRPIAFLSLSDFQNLSSGQLLIRDIKPSGFSEKCQIIANLRGGMVLSHDWHTNRACKAKESPAAISGTFRTSRGLIDIGVSVRNGKDEYWFGGEGYTEKGYKIIATAPVTDLKKGKTNIEPEELYKP